MLIIATIAAGLALIASTVALARTTDAADAKRAARQVSIRLLDVEHDALVRRARHDEQLAVFRDEIDALKRRR